MSGQCDAGGTIGVDIVRRGEGIMARRIQRERPCNQTMSSDERRWVEAGPSQVVESSTPMLLYREGNAG
jgi:hypothetical protein